MWKLNKPRSSQDRVKSCPIHGSGDSGDISNRSSDLPSLPKQTLHKTIRKFHALCDIDWPGPVLTLPLQPRKYFPSSDIPDRPAGVVNAPEESNETA